MAKRTFREMVTSRTVIASAPVEEAQFNGMIESVNEQFGLELAPSAEAFELFRDEIRFVAGRFWDHLDAVERKTVLKRMTTLSEHVKATKAQLCPSGRGCTRPPTPRSSSFSFVPSTWPMPANMPVLGSSSTSRSR